MTSEPTFWYEGHAGFPEGRYTAETWPGAVTWRSDIAVPYVADHRAEDGSMLLVVPTTMGGWRP